MARLVLGIELDSEARIAARNIHLLELVEQTGSISAAGRACGITYRQAWTRLDEVTRMFKAPVLAAQVGGRDGGGARLTDFGRQIVARFRAIEALAANLAEVDLDALEAASRPPPPVAS